VERPGDGLCVSVPLDGDDRAHRDAQLAALQLVEARMIPTEVRSDVIHPDAAIWDWRATDATLPQASDAGLSVLVTLTVAASTSTAPRTPPGHAI
jgi:hypothetical protein